MVAAGLTHYGEQLQHVAKGRRSLIASGNLLGIGPCETEIGDIVFVLLGSDTPYILRRNINKEDTFRLVGKTYLHGIMDGEALEKNITSETIALC